MKIQRVEANTKDEEQLVQQTYEWIGEQLGDDTSRDKIVKELVKSNWSKDTAEKMVDNVEDAVDVYLETPEGRRLLGARHRKLMVSGLLWFIGGSIVTVSTYILAEGGGWFLICFGAIIFGFVDFARGFVGWVNNR